MAAAVGRGHKKHAALFHLEEELELVELVFPFWIIKPDGGKPLLVDIGFPQDACERRGIDAYIQPEVLLARAGIDVKDIETVIVSHLHWDHFCRPERFPNAVFWIQDDDIRYFTGYGKAYKPVLRTSDAASLAAIPDLARTGRIRTVFGGETHIVPGVRTVHVGGHTPGMQITVCDMKNGPAVLAGDACHFYESFERRTPTGVYFRYDQFQDGLVTIEREKSATGEWFPGHDPAMLDKMTSLGGGLYRVPFSQQVTATGGSISTLPGRARSLT